MKKNDNIKLEQLLSQFMDRPRAEQAAADIRAGDRLFEQNPVPPVAGQVLQQIRTAVSKKARMQQRLGRLSYAGSGAAAAVIVLALLYGVRTQPISPDSTVASAPEAESRAAVVNVVSTRPLNAGTRNLWSRLASHESLVEIDRELTEVADSINAMQSEPYGDLVNTLKIDMLELEELELITANSDFWKG